MKETLQCLDKVMADIPEEWLINEAEKVVSDELDRIKLILNAFNHDNFWRAL